MHCYAKRTRRRIKWWTRRRNETKRIHRIFSEKKENGVIKRSKLLYCRCRLKFVYAWMCVWVCVSADVCSSTSKVLHAMAYGVGIRMYCECVSAFPLYPTLNQIPSKFSMWWWRLLSLNACAHVCVCLSIFRWNELHMAAIAAHSTCWNVAVRLRFSNKNSLQPYFCRYFCLSKFH